MLGIENLSILELEHIHLVHHVPAAVHDGPRQRGPCDHRHAQYR